ncbi:protein AE7 isoform X1 [Nicotiana tabacum]|uniref:Protein AE7 isoform X1 n=3 Tax=Nicotiana tabacum TaxID=4097 RepID=A0AC58UG98_TOBAC
MVSELINANPIVYEKKERRDRSAPSVEDEYTAEPIDQLEIFDHIRDIKDPEHPYSLEELKVITEDAVEVNDERSYVRVRFTPTVEHCSMATVIGLCLRVKLMRCLPSRYKMTETKPTVDVIPVMSKITENKFMGSNYMDWSKTIRLYLRSIDKENHLVDDPPKDETKSVWLKEDAKLFLQIKNSMHSEVDIRVAPGSHATEAAVNKQLNDKERVAAALENPNLVDMVDECLAPSYA